MWSLLVSFMFCLVICTKFAAETILNRRSLTFTYSFLNWRQKPSQTIGAFLVSVFGVIVVHLTVYGLYLVRLSVVSRRNRLREKSNPPGEGESTFQGSPCANKCGCGDT